VRVFAAKQKQESISVEKCGASEPYIVFGRKNWKNDTKVVPRFGMPRITSILLDHQCLGRTLERCGL